ncbi:MAG TPA: hypothetical protein VG734_05770 [Lacunisphaera sp.]|nr:hypothetical protein [Lacunisphaera sp.]
MKTILRCLVLGCAVSVFGQQAESLLAELPVVPENVCGRGDSIETFRKQLLEKLRDIDAGLAKCRKEERAAKKEMEARMRAQAMAAAGISPAMAAGAKHMSKEEKRALAAQVLKEQTGLTMEDIEMLKAKTPAEREAWATAKQQAGEIGPKTPPPAQPAAAALPGSGLTAEEMKEQQKLFEDSMALGSKLQARYSKLDLEYAAIQHPPKKQQKDGEEPPPDDICIDFTKRYKAILGDHYLATRQVVQSARRLDELTAKQYGLPTAPGAGHTALSAVRDYALKLQGILGKFSE